MRWGWWVVLGVGVLFALASVPQVVERHEQERQAARYMQDWEQTQARQEEVFWSTVLANRPDVTDHRSGWVGTGRHVCDQLDMVGSQGGAATIGGIWLSIPNVDVGLRDLVLFAATRPGSFCEYQQQTVDAWTAEHPAS